MKRLFSLVMVSVVIAATSNGCAKPTPEPVEGPNLLVALEGDVQVKREGWSDYIPVGFGTLVLYGDLLQVDGTASVLCGDLIVQTVSGLDNSPCPPGPGWLERKDALYGPGRLLPAGTEVRATPDFAPYVQHPRNTLVLDPRPLLRWHDTQASSYTVAVMQGGRTIWTQPDVEGNEVRYPADAPALRPGVDYLLMVVDNDTGLSSDEDPTRGIGFQVVAQENQAAIEAHRDEILALSSLDGPARDFALAVYYATWQAPEEIAGSGRALWGEAWLLLESVAQRQDAPAVHLWMGDVLATTKLPTEAEAAYGATLQRAEVLGDLETQAAAHVGLWQITEDEDHWEQALELYRRLGDEDAVEALSEEGKP